MLLREREQNFVNFKSEEHRFPAELWPKVRARPSFARWSQLRSSSSYGLAVALHRARARFLEGYSLGAICHLVHLGLAQGRLAPLQPSLAPGATAVSRCAASPEPLEPRPRGAAPVDPARSAMEGCYKWNFESLGNAAGAAPIVNTFIHFAEDTGFAGKRHRTCPWSWLSSNEPQADLRIARACEASAGVAVGCVSSNLSETSTDAASQSGSCSEDEHTPTARVEKKQSSQAVSQELSEHLKYLRRRGSDVMSRLRFSIPAAKLVSRSGMESQTRAASAQLKLRPCAARRAVPPPPPPPPRVLRTFQHQVWSVIPPR